MSKDQGQDEGQNEQSADPGAGFLKRRILHPILAQLRRGTSPDSLSWAIAWGATLSLFPFLGVTTGLCLLAGFAFRLNHVAVQTANYLFGPLQLILLPVWIRAGEKLFGLSPVGFNPVTAAKELFASPGGFFTQYGRSTAAAITIWALVAPAVFFGVRAASRPILGQLLRRLKPLTRDRTRDRSK